MLLQNKICFLHFINAFGILLIVNTNFCSAMTATNDVAKVLKELKVVPDVIAKAPNQLLKVTFKSGLLGAPGVELTPTQVQAQPQVEWQAETNDYYTLIMTDPDAPSRANPKNREYLHWLVGNIPGSAVGSGEVITAYVGSGPPKDTGLHRYVLLLYKQQGKLTFDEPRVSNHSGQNRAKFSAAKFAKKHQLGDAVAANFYQAKYDDYVPTVHKQLSGK